MIDLIDIESNSLPPPLVQIATTDSAANARNAAAAAICELLKLAGSIKAREAFDRCEGAEETWLKTKMDAAMASGKLVLHLELSCGMSLLGLNVKREPVKSIARRSLL